MTCNLCRGEHPPSVLCSVAALPLEQAIPTKGHDRTKDLTDARGAVYGHPAEHFARTTGMLNALGIGTGLGAMDWPFVMICDKLARLRESPEHRDGWEDIAGYARTALMILDRHGL